MNRTVFIISTIIFSILIKSVSATKEEGKTLIGGQTKLEQTKLFSSKVEGEMFTPPLMPSVYNKTKAITGLVCSVTPNKNKPYSSVDFLIKIPDYRKSSTQIQVYEGDWEKGEKTARYISYNVNDIKPDSSFTKTIGGLESGKKYVFSFLLIDKSQSIEILVQKVSFETLPEPSGLRQKLLFVIDDDLKESQGLNNKILEYCSDINKIEPNIDFETYYLKNNNRARKDLYDTICLKYNKSNLEYLFFIGNNSPIKYTHTNFNDNNDIVYISDKPSVSYYSFIFNQVVQFDQSKDVFYFNNGGSFSCKILNTASSEIKFGIVSSPSFNYNDKEKFIIDYFSKLGLYRKGQINYGKSSLLSLTLFPNADQLVTEKLKATNRFNEVYQIKSSHVYNPWYFYLDDVWKNDYLTTLDKEKFELCILNVHGTPYEHQFGIYTSEINKLNNINTLLFYVGACSVGDISSPNNLGSTYLGKGNTLNVLCYTAPIGITDDAFESFLSENSNPNFLYDISKGEIVSKSIQNSGLVNTELVNLGDPLLSLNYNNLKANIYFSDSLRVELSDNISKYEFKWYYEGVPLPNSNSKSISPKWNGKYSVEVSNNDCYVESQKFNYVSKLPTELSDIKQKVSIYPNPSRDWLTINGINSKVSDVVAILDINGKVISEFESHNSELKINIKNLKSGIYFVRINKEMFKFFKQ